MKIFPAASMLATAMALILTGCGGGGGSRSNANPGTEVGGGNGTGTGGGTGGGTGSGGGTGNGGGNTGGGGTGGELPDGYSGVADNLLMVSGADKAHDAGVTGSQVKVGVMDGSRIDGFAGLPGSVASYTDYTDGAVDPQGEQYTHGSSIASIVAGAATSKFAGGVAPDANVWWARVCTSGGACSSPLVSQAAFDLIDDGVRILNMSFGTYTSDADSIASAPAYQALVDAVVEADALAIAATGNNSAGNASTISAAPYYLGTGSRNWLAVTAGAVDGDGEISGPASYANACGVAANWCLTAAGTVALDGGQIAGTSVATATVSGVAALVAQVYPWMTGSNLQATLLSTATDLGDVGVDATYGWGLVNAERAIRGPAQFASDFTAEVGGYDSTFTNNITGTGGLIKEGNGTLRLAGTNTYTGDTLVNAGILGLTGSLTSNVIVGSGAVFQTMGGVIDGDYTTAGITDVYLDRPLTVTGTATLGGSLNLRSTEAYTVPSTATVLNAGAVAGTFASYGAGSSLFTVASVAYDDTSVTATLTRASSSASASVLDMNASVVDGGAQADVIVGALDTAVTNGASSASIGSVVDSVAAILNTEDLQTVAANLTSLTGEVYGTARTLAFQQAATDQRIIGDRLNALSYNTDGAVWFQGFGGDGTLSRDGYADADVRSNGAAVGVELPVAEDISIGGALFTSKNTADLDAVSGRFRGRTNGLALYGRRQFDGAYLAGLIGYSNLEADVSRAITYGTNAEQLASNYDNDILHGRIEVGMTTSVELSPYLAVAGYRIKQGRIQENTDSGLGLLAGSSSFGVTLGEAGLRYGHRFNALYLGANLSVAHVLSGDDEDFVAAFDGLQDVTFNVAGQPIPQTSTNVGIHGAYRVNGNVDIFADVNGQWASGGSDQVTGTLGLRVGF